MKEATIDLNLEKMSFSEAMQNLIEGKKVRREIWDEGDYLRLDTTQGCFVNYFAEDNDHVSDFSLGSLDIHDALAVDWSVLEYLSAESEDAFEGSDSLMRG